MYWRTYVRVHVYRGKQAHALILHFDFYISTYRERLFCLLYFLLCKSAWMKCAFVWVGTVWAKIIFFFYNLSPHLRIVVDAYRSSILNCYGIHTIFYKYTNSSTNRSKHGGCEKLVQGLDGRSLIRTWVTTLGWWHGQRLKTIEEATLPIRFGRSVCLDKRSRTICASRGLGELRIRQNEM